MSSKTTTVLPDGFVPGEMDVIVGRGKVCYKHSGNQKLTRMVQAVLGTYSSSEATKKSKSDLIKGIMVQIREGSPDGGFVKFDNDAGQWFEVGDRIAREKVSQTFRDALNDRYKSSTTSKTLKRRQERINRQTSGGSKDGGSAAHSMLAGGIPRPTIAQHEISGAQARVDALLSAATSGPLKVNGMLPRPSLSTLPPLPAMSSFAHLRPAGLIPAAAAAPQSLAQGLAMSTISNMPPVTNSLTSLMAANGQLFLNRESRKEAQLKLSLMSSLYQQNPSVDL